MRAVVCALALFAAAITAAAPLRFATAAPDGTAWARAMRAFARDLESASGGEVSVKWYWGGVAGAELQVHDRINRGQLDGIASSGPLCQKLAPTWRAMQIAGLVQSRDEALHLLSALRPRYEPEARQQGYEVLGASTIGPALAFLDRPVKDLAELRALRLWLMPDDDVSHLMAEAMGMKTVRLPLAEAAHAFDDKKIDGFFTIPGAALAFQWSIRARYLPDLRVGWVAGCFLVSSRAFYKLSQKGQQALRSTSAKLTAHMEDVARQQDQALLEGGLFQKQGVKRFEVSRDLRAQFLAASREARDRLGPKLVSPELLQHVMSLLADWRAEHERR